MYASHGVGGFALHTHPQFLAIRYRIQVYIKFEDLLPHARDFYVKSKYSKIVHFKGVLAILVYKWQVVTKNAENEWNPLKCPILEYSDFG